MKPTIFVWICSLLWIVTSLEVDKRGYLVYCPCMGRFGNQVEQFLGTLNFARTINRTLILPPWVEFHNNQKNSVQIPFNIYFKTEPLEEYHRVITMETFMEKLAPTVWPPKDRIVFCYSSPVDSPDTNDCRAKDGNPFGPFWDTYGIDFVRSEMFMPLSHSSLFSEENYLWNKRYPPDRFPVLAFVIPPADFPLAEKNVWLQRYLEWSDEFEQNALEFIEEEIKEKPFLGIHLRNDIDFENACSDVENSTRMFASSQCTGYRNAEIKLTLEMCYPSDQTVVQQVRQEVQRTKVNVVFVAADNRHMITEFSEAMPEVRFVRQADDPSPHLDLAILGKADHFIGNCISTFSAFITRQRDLEELSTSFWAFEQQKQHDEL